MQGMVSLDILAAQWEWPRERLQRAIQQLAQQHVLLCLQGRLINPWTRLPPETLVAEVYPRGYLSGEWALAWHGCLSQQPLTLWVVDTQAERNPPMPLTELWGIESSPPLPEGTPDLVLVGVALPMASPVQALLDWAYWRWMVPRAPVAELASFLSDCDLDGVQEPLTALAASASITLRGRLAQQILQCWVETPRC